MNERDNNKSKEEKESDECDICRNQFCSIERHFPATPNNRIADERKCIRWNQQIKELYFLKKAFSTLYESRKKVSIDEDSLIELKASILSLPQNHFPPNNKINKKICLSANDSTEMDVDLIMFGECCILPKENGCYSVDDYYHYFEEDVKFKYIYNMVGPIESFTPELLRSNYTEMLKYVVDHHNDIKTIAISCVTGISSNLSIPAIHIILRTIREYLDRLVDDKIEDVIELITFFTKDPKDLEIYESLLQYYFPIDLPTYDFNNPLYDPDNSNDVFSSSLNR